MTRLASQWRRVAPYYFGDFYPLTTYTTDNSAWVAWQFHQSETGDGMVQSFRRLESPIEKARFKLRGLDSAAQYSVSNLDAPGESQFSGRELAEHGLPVTIEDEPGAVIIVYKKVKSSR